MFSSFRELINTFRFSILTNEPDFYTLKGQNYKLCYSVWLLQKIILTSNKNENDLNLTKALIMVRVLFMVRKGVKVHQMLSCQRIKRLP